MNSVFSTDVSIPRINLGKDDISFNFLMFIIVIVVFVIVVVPWDKLSSKKIEGMMNGAIVSQLMAQDSQDVYLKGNVDKLATGNVTMMFNQPTRVLNTYMNRGSPLYSIVLPNTPMNPTNNVLQVSNNYIDNIDNIDNINNDNDYKFSNPILSLDYVFPKQLGTTNSKSDDDKNDYLSIFEENQSTKSTKSTKYVPTISKNILPSSLPINIVTNSNPYELGKVAKQVSKTKQTKDNLPPLTKWTDENKLFQLYTNKTINCRDCEMNPTSCSLGSVGGSRLNDAFVQSTKAVNYVNLDENYYYPDSYLANYYNVNFNTPDINKPYPIVLNKV